MKALCLSRRTNWNWEVYLILLECFVSGHSCMWLSYAILLYSWEVYSGQCMLLSQSQVLGIMKKAILATDLARFFGNKDCLQTILSSGEFSWENQQHRWSHQKESYHKSTHPLLLAIINWTINCLSLSTTFSCMSLTFLLRWQSLLSDQSACRARNDTLLFLKQYLI